MDIILATELCKISCCENLRKIFLTYFMFYVRMNLRIIFLCKTHENISLSENVCEIPKLLNIEDIFCLKNKKTCKKNRNIFCYTSIQYDTLFLYIKCTRFLHLSSNS